MQPRRLETVGSLDVLWSECFYEANAQTSVALGSEELVELAGLDPLQ